MFITGCQTDKEMSIFDYLRTKGISGTTKLSRTLVEEILKHFAAHGNIPKSEAETFLYVFFNELNVPVLKDFIAESVPELGFGVTEHWIFKKFLPARMLMNSVSLLLC